MSRGQTSFDALLTPPAQAPLRPAEPELKPLSVTQLNDKAARMLEGQLGQVYVLGEISGFKLHQSGHWYFNLKDDGAQISACCFKGSQRTMTFRPRDGQQVIARGKVTVYGARGSYQMVIDQMQPAGAGLLQQKFEELKARLAAEGLFAQGSQARGTTHGAAHRGRDQSRRRGGARFHSHRHAAASGRVGRDLPRARARRRRGRRSRTHDRSRVPACTGARAWTFWS